MTGPDSGGQENNPTQGTPDAGGRESSQPAQPRRPEPGGNMPPKGTRPETGDDPRSSADKARERFEALDSEERIGYQEAGTADLVRNYFELAEDFGAGTPVARQRVEEVATDLREAGQENPKLAAWGEGLNQLLQAPQQPQQAERSRSTSEPSESEKTYQAMPTDVKTGLEEAGASEAVKEVIELVDRASRGENVEAGLKRRLKELSDKSKSDPRFKELLADVSTRIGGDVTFEQLIEGMETPEGYDASAEQRAHREAQAQDATEALRTATRDPNNREARENAEEKLKKVADPTYLAELYNDNKLLYYLLITGMLLYSAYVGMQYAVAGVAEQWGKASSK